MKSQILFLATLVCCQTFGNSLLGGLRKKLYGNKNSIFFGNHQSSSSSSSFSNFFGHNSFFGGHSGSGFFGGTTSTTNHKFVFGNCPSLPPSRLIETRAIVTLVGRPDDISPAEITALEESFASSYNSVVSCDGTERTVVQVEIQEVTETRRQRRSLLVGNNSTMLNFSPNSTVTRPFSLYYSVVIRCRGCTDDSLFDNDGFRRLQETTPFKFKGNKILFRGMRNGNKKIKKQMMTVNNIGRNTRKSTITKREETTQVTRKAIYLPAPCTKCRAPSPQTFSAAYDSSIRSLVSEGVLTSVDNVEQTVELLPITCDANVEILETRIALDIATGGALTGEDLEVLAEAFQETYNGLNALNDETCDLRFREIVDVSVESTDLAFSRRRHLLQQNDTTGTNNNTFAFTPSFTRSETSAFLFVVSFRCRGCSNDEDIFDDDGFRRSLKTANHILTDSRNLQSVEGDCVCAPNAQVFQAPSRADFTAAFSDTVEILATQGDLTVPVLVEGTQELEPMACSSDINVQQTVVGLDFLGSPGAITEAERDELEQGFADTYNELVQSFCDPVFRTIVDVDIVGPPILLNTSGDLTAGPLIEVAPTQSAPGTNRNLQMNDTSDFLSNATLTLMPFRFNFLVSFRCRGCDDDTDLFDDGFRRILGGMSRSLQAADICFCDVNPVSLRSPTAEEFETAFNDAIESGEVDAPNVVSTIDVVETTVASLPATDFPSEAPISLAPIAPITFAPVTSAPVTSAPVTPAPVTAAPTEAPITPAPVTAAPVTAAPVTDAPTTQAPVTSAPITPAPVTDAPITPAPVTPAPVTDAPITPAPVTPAPITAAPVTPAPVTPAPTTDAPTNTEVPVSLAPVTDVPTGTGFPVSFSPEAFAPAGTPTSSRSAPDDSPELTELFSFPFRLFSNITGEPLSDISTTQFPIYDLDNWTNQTGTFLGLRSTETNEFPIAVTITSIQFVELDPDSLAPEVREFVFIDNYESVLVTGQIEGSTATPEPFLGLVVTSELGGGATLLPLSDPFDFAAPSLPPPDSTLIIDSPPGTPPGIDFVPSDQGVRKLDGRTRSLQTVGEEFGIDFSACDGFEEEALESFPCEASVFFNQECLDFTRNSLRQEADEIGADIAVVNDVFQQNLLSVFNERAQSMSRGYADCLTQIFNGDLIDLEECAATAHREATEIQASAVIEFQDEREVALEPLLETARGRLTELCNRAVFEIPECFRCSLCDLSVAQCCSSFDCFPEPFPETCENNICAEGGFSHIALSWTGADDYELEITTPRGRIFSLSNPVDPITGETIVRRIAGSPGVFGRHVVNVILPFEDGDGSFRYRVNVGSIIVREPDTWTINAYAFGDLVRSETGSGASDEFTFFPPQ